METDMPVSLEAYQQTPSRTLSTRLRGPQGLRLALAKLH